MDFKYQKWRYKCRTWVLTSPRKRVSYYICFSNPRFKSEKNTFGVFFSGNWGMSYIILMSMLGLVTIHGDCCTDHLLGIAPEQQQQHGIDGEKEAAQEVAWANAMAMRYVQLGDLNIFKAPRIDTKLADVHQECSSQKMVGVVPSPYLEQTRRSQKTYETYMCICS